MDKYQLQFKDDWGGFVDNTSGSLRPASGAEVQEFIKSQFGTKVGYTHVLKNQALTDGEYHVILGFSNEEAWEEWEKAGSKIPSDLIVSQANVPVAQPDPGYIIKFQSKSEKETVTVGDSVKLQFKFNTYYFDPSSGTSFESEEGKLVISKRLSASGEFTPVEFTKYTVDGGYKQNINGIESDNDSWNEVDITNILSPGNQDIMITITGLQSGLSTSYIYKINNVNMKLEFITDWARTQDITGSSNPSLLLEYKVGGSVNKTLNLNISAGEDIDGNTIFKSYKRTLGYNPIDAYTVTNLVDKDILTHGIHQIEAWLTVDGRNIETPHIWSQVMVVADKEDTTPYMMVNNCVDSLVNWTQQDIFQYAIYHPTLTEVPIDIKFTNMDGDITYLSASKGQSVKVKETYGNNISINTSGDFSVKASVETNGHVLWSKQFPVANDGMYAPTQGATFTLDVKNRYNNEAQPRNIYNAITNEKINSEWLNMAFNENSGWLNDANGVKCLRLLSGQQLNISYNPYDKWTNQLSCAMEFDIATRNITNTLTSLIRICNYNIPGASDIPNGFELRPTDAMVGLVGCTDRLEQDIAFQDETRTHIMLTYTYRADSYKDGNNDVYLNYVRIYVNGCLTRVFEYKTSTPWNGQDPIDIKLGNTVHGADLDVYNLRFYQDVKLTSDDVFQNYLSSLATVEEKTSLLEANDIYEGGEVAFNKVYGKYNTLVWKPNEHSAVKDGVYETRLATFGDGEDTKFKGDLEINIVGDKKRSGVITNLTTKGQGTSSMNYFKWNQRWEFGKIDGHDSLFISNLEIGKDENDEPIYETHKGKYQLVEGIPYAKRLDGKINWASPMQSHKMGSTALYNDLWKAVVKDNTITKAGKGTYNEEKDEYSGVKFTGTENGYADCRVAIKQLPFFVFVQEKSTDSAPKFYGLYTMGPSKGDKPTFGYDSKEFPKFIMMEGCNNETPVVMYGAPWNDIDVKLNDDGEIFLYLESKNVDENTGEVSDVWTEQWEISMGDYDEDFVQKFKEINNFIYTCNPFINPFDGTYAELNLESNQSKLYKNEMYWVKKGEDVPKSGALQQGIDYKYNLYRWDSYIERWVNAGVNHIGETRDSDYDVVNMYVQTGINPANYSSEDANKEFVNWRANLFNTKVAEYFDLDDLRFTVQFLKLIAASDNWAKNTYLYSTGINSEGKLDPIRFFQDDLDTIFATNNVGYKAKTYYIEEHDGEEVVKNPDGALAQAAVKGQAYWVSSKNALYTLAEKVLDMPGMMKSILEQAASLGGSLANSSLTKLEDCFKKYYFDATTKSFPIKAYNEISKMYEDAHKAKSDGRGYNAPASALAQVTGNAVQGEFQWVKQRMAYISSYAQYGLFGAGDGKGGGQGVFTFRTAQPMDAKKFTFTMTPSMWLYPSVDVAGNSAQAKRTPAGQPVVLNSNAKENQTVTVRGVDYLYSMGDLSSLYTDTAGLSIAASKLKDFTISGNTGFQPSSLTFNGVPNMVSIKLNGSGLLKNISTVNVSGAPRLTTVDLTGTSINSVNMPAGSNIRQLLLPSTVVELKIDDLKDLESLSLNRYSNLTSVTITNMENNVNVNSKYIFNKCFEANAPLNTFVATVNWKGLTQSQWEYLLNIKNLNISGIIDITGDGNADMDFDTKMKLIDKFGNIDDPENTLHIIYDIKYLGNKNTVAVLGVGSVYENGEYGYSLKYMSSNTISANDFTNIKWSLSTNDFGTIDQKSGVFTFVDDPSVTNKADRELTIYCDVTRLTQGGGTNSFQVSRNVYLYQLPAKVGDYVYADGTWASPEDDRGEKTIVGVCFYAEGNDPASQKRLAVGVELANPDTATVKWGLNESVTASGNRTYSYDVPELANYTDTGTLATNSFYINSDTGYYAITNPSRFNNGGITDIGWEESSRGKSNTKKIINYRDTILTAFGEWNPGQYADENLNSEYEYLVNKKNDGNLTPKHHPAASYCYAYQPGCKTGAGALKLKTGEKLADKFKAHNWFLPSCGELVHIWYYLHLKQVPNVGPMESFGLNYKNVIPAKSYIWSSTEGSTTGTSGYSVVPKAHAIQFEIGSTTYSMYWAGCSNLSSQVAGYKDGSSYPYTQSLQYVLPVVEF